MTQESMVGVPGQEVVRIGTPDGRMAAEFRGPEGACSVIVCLHGLSANRATWLPVAERLAGRRRLLLVDLLGRGESDASPDARYDLASEVGRLRLLLSSVGVDRPLLAGHSHGAAIAAAAVSRVDARGLLLVNPVTPDLPRPAPLAALRSRTVRILFSPTLRLFRRPLTRYMLVRRVFADRRVVSADLIARYADPWRDAGRAAGLARILADWDPAELERWGQPAGVPVSVLAGAEDRRVPPESARAWADRLGGTFQLISGCGHSVPEERPTQTAATVEELLTAMSSRRQEET